MTKLAKLSHDLDPAEHTCRAVIETSKGNRSKFAYDPKADYRAIVREIQPSERSRLSLRAIADGDRATLVASRSAVSESSR